MALPTYELNLQNPNASLLTYIGGIIVEFQNAVDGNHIKGFCVKELQPNCLVVDIAGEGLGFRGKQWHQDIEKNLKNNHNMRHLCYPPNSDTMFGPWKEV